MKQRDKSIPENNGGHASPICVLYLKTGNMKVKIVFTKANFIQSARAERTDTFTGKITWFLHSLPFLTYQSFISFYGT